MQKKSLRHENVFVESLDRKEGELVRKLDKFYDFLELFGVHGGSFIVTGNWFELIIL